MVTINGALCPSFFFCPRDEIWLDNDTENYIFKGGTDMLLLIAIVVLFILYGTNRSGDVPVENFGEWMKEHALLLVIVLLVLFYIGR